MRGMPRMVRVRVRVRGRGRVKVRVRGLSRRHHLLGG